MGGHRPAALSGVPGSASSSRPAIGYWTGIWEPTREALSKEVAALRRALSPGSAIVSFTPQNTALLWRDRVLRLNVHRWAALKLAAAVLERRADVTHVFGGVDAAHFLLVLGRRPIVFTVAIPGAPLAADLYDKVAFFVAESETIADTLRAAGVPASRLEVIYPGIDLARYSPTPAPDTPFELLFASTPSHVVDMESRGIWLLLELARLRPDVRIVLLWRTWGDVPGALAAIAAHNPPVNFVVKVVDARDMPAQFASAHATVCCFAEGLGKSAPNSILEGLASGRPTLVSDTCGVAAVIGAHGAGAVTPRTVEGLSDGIDRIRENYGAAAAAARRLAEAKFDRRAIHARYAAIYDALAAGRPAGADR
jgi:glycosyltransferase involved in cell wall biosynthesis